MGEDEELLIEGLRRRFPEAQLVRGDVEENRHRLKLVLAFAEDPFRGLDLPLDVRGTDFQRRVWQALRTISVGQTSCRSAATCSSPRRTASPSRN
jgi:AraC family transcriptional regulator of adaptative response/methylated-DNA-[protein]-cysteine methyltransferase